ncbi:hypothetical protein B0H13DRAFT_2368374 [Mycena leptocephala]|nr:hypothetical protein B0H13DRAFT_2368374 [Mycena leptocephala]
MSSPLLVMYSTRKRLLRISLLRTEPTPSETQEDILRSVLLPHDLARTLHHENPVCCHDIQYWTELQLRNFRVCDDEIASEHCTHFLIPRFGSPYAPDLRVRCRPPRTLRTSALLILLRTPPTLPFKPRPMPTRRWPCFFPKRRGLDSSPTLKQADTVPEAEHGILSAANEHGRPSGTPQSPDPPQPLPMAMACCSPPRSLTPTLFSLDLLAFNDLPHPAAHPPLFALTPATSTAKGLRRSASWCHAHSRGRGAPWNAQLARRPLARHTPLSSALPSGSSTRGADRQRRAFRLSPPGPGSLSLLSPRSNAYLTTESPTTIGAAAPPSSLPLSPCATGMRATMHTTSAAAGVGGCRSWSHSWLFATAHVDLLPPAAQDRRFGAQILDRETEEDPPTPTLHSPLSTLTLPPNFTLKVLPAARILPVRDFTKTPTGPRGINECADSNIHAAVPAVTNIRRPTSPQEHQLAPSAHWDHRTHRTTSIESKKQEPNPALRPEAARIPPLACLVRASSFELRELQNMFYQVLISTLLPRS